MILIDVSLDHAGLIYRCNVEGHADTGPKGSDLVCAAVSVLARTALMVLSDAEGIMVRGKAPERGLFRMEVEYLAEKRDFYSGISCFLLEGFDSISKEYPDNCIVRKHTERRQQNGS